MTDAAASGPPALHVTPVPTDEEAAAIVAAITAGLPGGGGEPPRASVPRWRFSGRWWSRPVPVRRARPSS